MVPIGHEMPDDAVLGVLSPLEIAQHISDQLPHPIPAWLEYRSNHWCASPVPKPAPSAADDSTGRIRKSARQPSKNDGQSEPLRLVAKRRPATAPSPKR